MGSRAAARHNALGLGSPPRSLLRSPTCPPPPSRGLPALGSRPGSLRVPLPGSPPTALQAPLLPAAPRAARTFEPSSFSPAPRLPVGAPHPLGPLASSPPLEPAARPSLQRSPFPFNPSPPPSLFSPILLSPLTLSPLPPTFLQLFLSLFSPLVVSLFADSVSLYSPALNSKLLSTYP